MRRQGEPREDAWTRAVAASSFDSHLARVLSIAVPLAWLVGSGAILVRHAEMLHDLLVGGGFWLPLDANVARAAHRWLDR